MAYKGYSHTVKALQFDAHNLTGGVIGTQPSIKFEVIRNSSMNVLFDPVNYHLMRTVSLKPSITVTVNDVPSVCLGDCGFEFQTVINSIIGYTLQPTHITIELSESLGATDVVFVVLGTDVCWNTTFNGTEVYCSNGPTGTLQLIAGFYLPQVYAYGIGFLPTRNGVASLTISMNLTSLSPTNGTMLGGNLVKIMGYGLPL